MTPTCRFVRRPVAAAWLFLATVAASNSQAAPESPDRWTEFVETKGQRQPIPKVWLATEAGRQAHDLVLPASMPTPVPFDFQAAQFKALVPFSKTPSVREQYWRHLCATEAGQFIFRTVENVDGLAYMRRSQQQNETLADEDPWLYEAPAFEITGVDKPDSDIAGWYIRYPFATYMRVEFPGRRSGDGWVRHGRSGNESEVPDWFAGDSWQRERIAGPSERYAVTWRGIHRERDREHLIGGHELIVLDRSTSEVLAVVRDFGLGAKTGKFQYGLTWRNTGTCFELGKWYAARDGDVLHLLAPRVLQPKKVPLRLINNDRKLTETRN